MNRSIKTNRNFLKVFCLHCFRIFVVLAQFFGPFFGQFSLQFFRTWWWLPPGIFVILVSLAQVCVASFSFLFFLALQIRFLVPCESVNDPVFFFFFLNLFPYLESNVRLPLAHGHLKNPPVSFQQMVSPKQTQLCCCLSLSRSAVQGTRAPLLISRGLQCQASDIQCGDCRASEL